MSDYGEPPPEVVARLRPICVALPEAYEERAWVGTRWRIRTRTFAHVLDVEAGHPRAYAQAAGTDTGSTVLTFRSAGAELDVLTRAGPPFFKPGWHPSVVGLVITETVDWTEVTELLTESYRLLAPRKLAAMIG